MDLVQGTLKINFITGFQNCMIKYEKFGQTIQLIQSTFKIFASYVDLFKDTFLASTLLVVVGGPASIFAYPTQFTSTIVMVLWVTIIIPLMSSTLYLILNNPFLLLRVDVSRASMVILCLMFWVINPIILRHRYEAAQEKTRQLIKRDNANGTNRALSLRRIERNIKNHLVQFFKIELGKNF